MEAEKINLFIATKGDYFPSETIPMIKERMTYLASDNEMAIMAADYTNPILSIVLSVVLGGYGIDRFLIGDIGIGIGKLLTGGGCGVWWLIDIFLIMDATKRKNFEKFITITG